MQSSFLQKKENTSSANFRDEQAKRSGITLPAVHATQVNPIQKKENKTGLPDNIKTGIEQLSGVGLNDVKVHYNSARPAQLQAFAFAQGTDIHVAPGQEKHLAHEAWHVVQQKQGRVQATAQLKDAVPVNENKALEQEADMVGAKAVRFSPQQGVESAQLKKEYNNSTANGYGVVQKTPSTDIDHAKQNAKHLRDETYPGIFADFRTVYRGVRTQINNYIVANHAHPIGTDLDRSAEGLLKFSQNLIESADGKWTEAAEMARLINKNYLPVAARNNATDADIEYDKMGNTTGIEAKSCNTHVAGDVTQHIDAADTQLGTRPNVQRGKITMWVAHQSNRWPGVHGFNARTTNGTIQTHVQNQLNGMNLPNTQVIKILMVRTPNAYPGAGKAVDVKAVGGHGHWVATVVNVH